MPADDFKTVGIDLVHIAADAETHFVDQAYEVQIEHREIGFPFTPTLLCRRGHETIIVEVMSVLDRDRMSRWLRYARSQTVDTRLCVVCRIERAVDPKDLAFATDNRLGLLVHDDQTMMEIRAPADLAVHVELPELRDLPNPVRPLLASAYRKLRENDWRDGLSDAYLEVEQHARTYLKDGVTTGRFVLKPKKGAAITEQRIDQMTLGQLKDAFKLIPAPTYKDSIIGRTLDMINKTRVGLAHRRRNVAVEAGLRQQVGQHMYAVIDCLEELTR